MQAKRLYEMGGNITEQFYPSNFSESTMLSDGKRPSKKAKRYNKRNVLCKGSKCYNPNR